MPIIRKSGGSSITPKKIVLTDDLIVRDSTNSYLIIDPNGSDRNIILLLAKPKWMIIRNLNGNYKLKIKDSQEMSDEDSYGLSTFDGVLEVSIAFDGTDYHFTNSPGIDYINYGNE